MDGSLGVAGGVEFCLECHLVMPCLNGAIAAYARDHPYTSLSVREIRERLGQADERLGSPAGVHRRPGGSVSGEPHFGSLPDIARRSSNCDNLVVEVPIIRLRLLDGS